MGEKRVKEGCLLRPRSNARRREQDLPGLVAVARRGACRRQRHRDVPAIHAVRRVLLRDVELENARRDILLVAQGVAALVGTPGQNVLQARVLHVLQTVVVTAQVRCGVGGDHHRTEFLNQEVRRAVLTRRVDGVVATDEKVVRGGGGEGVLNKRPLIVCHVLVRGPRRLDKLVRRLVVVGRSGGARCRS